MNTTKLLLFIALFFMTIMNSQTTTMVTTNVQSHLINKFWSSKLNENNVVLFNFTQNGLSLFIANKKIGGAESYYLAPYDEVKTTTTFSESKIGRLSSGNHIVTKREIYIIEFYSDLQKFRIKKIFDGTDKWQTFYLVNATPFFNTPKSGEFTRNNCGTGNIGMDGVYDVEAGKHISYVSQADADAKAQADVNTNGQNFVNGEAHIYCIYYNKETTREVTKNNCPTGKVGTKLSYTVPAGRYSSEESEEVVEVLVNSDFIHGPGQEYANINCSCVYTNTAKYGRFTKNNCPIGAVDRYEYNHTVPAGKYFSNVSQQAADDLAVADLNLNGQIYANANNTCIYKSISRSVTVRRNNCPSGKVGSLYTYTVPAGDKTSTISQADADAQVDATLYYWAQYFANSRGSCN